MKDGRLRPPILFLCLQPSESQLRAAHTHLMDSPCKTHLQY